MAANKKTTTSATARDARLAEITEAIRRELEWETLQDQRSGKDFHEVAVWNVRKIIEMAFDAGFAAGRAM